MIIFGDPHILDKNIEELDIVFTEISTYLNKTDIAICLGDYYHNKRPTATELEFGTKWAKYFVKNSSSFYMLRGNHPMLNFIANDSSVEYLRYLGVNVVEDLVIDNIYFGHKMTEKSDMYYGMQVPNISRYQTTTEELKKYRYAFLGHQHQFEIINDSIYHLGGIVYNNFGEVISDKRYIILLNNDVNLIELRKVIPMIDVTNIEDLYQISENSKVRFIFNDFVYFKNNISKLKEFKNKFREFKTKFNFNKENKINIINTINKTDILKREVNTKNIIKKWLDKIKDKDVRKELENEIVCLWDFEKESV